MKKIFILILLFLSCLNLFATHNRAGEITYEHISGNTYKITLITYTYTPSAANESRDVLTMQWGDDTSTEIPRISIEYLPDEIQKNTYVRNHTFPGPGVYQIVMSDPNRNEGIINIPESVTVVFTIRTTLKIDPAIGHNNTPIMLNPPIDKAALHQIFIHNPNAFDPDGDSISYKLSICLGPNAVPINGYTYPSASISLTVDEVTGDFIWNTPIQIGEYNVAMEIEEWRNGVKIGSIIRDMQIEVEETDNNPPIIATLPDFCVTAGDLLTFDVSASDPDNDNITLSASGGPFEFTNNPAEFPEITGSSPVQGTFNWNTLCEHIRQQQYNVLFRAEDDNPEVGLTDYENTMINVVAPAPENLNSSPTGNSVLLNWDNYNCSNAIGFRIYRRIGSYTYTPSNCNVGIPAGSGYIFVGTISGPGTTSFEDDNNNIGLPQGYEYCYRISAFFEDNAESYVSNETCSELLRDAPVIIETSVINTNETNGNIQLTWMQPTDFNPITYPGPYKYILKSRTGQSWENFSNPVDIMGIANTSYTDININTKDDAKSYSIALYSQNGSNWDKVGNSSKSSSLFIEGLPGNKRMTIKINDSTPWTNKQYVIYRKDSDSECNTNATPYDSITTVTGTYFTNHGLDNDLYYWFQVKSIGEYDLGFIPKPLINYSQEICVSPQDTTPPCPVNLFLESDCDLFRNYLNWTVDLTCAPDIDNFYIFYSDSIAGPYQLIDTLYDNNARSYTHLPEESLGACYIVSPVDSAGNYINPDLLTRTCIDECDYYELPNVFTPNGDGINDLFIPIRYTEHIKNFDITKFVEKIDLTIYNRWGNPVFKTEDPDIKWDGIDFETNKLVSEGVYYYVCDVYEKRLSGIEVRNIAGLIRIFNNLGNKGIE